MSYNPVNWANGEEGGTPMSASNLNRMDKGIADAHSMLAEHDKKIDDFAKEQLPEEYVKSAVDTYVEENSAGLVTDAELAETKESFEEKTNQLSSEIEEVNDDLLKLANDGIIRENVETEYKNGYMDVSTGKVVIVDNEKYAYAYYPVNDMSNYFIKVHKDFEIYAREFDTDSPNYNYAFNLVDSWGHSGETIPCYINNGYHYIGISLRHKNQTSLKNVSLDNAVRVYSEKGSIFSSNRVINVSKSESAEFKSLTKAIFEAEKSFGTTIYVESGVYDLIEEIKEHFGSTYFDNFVSGGLPKDAGIPLLNRVKIFFSSGALVKCHYTGNNDNVKSWFSPFNACEHGFELHNLKMQASNVRYNIHDERRSFTDSYRNIYEHCDLKLDNSNNNAWAGVACIGGGLGIYGDVVIKDCVCESVGAENRYLISYHNSGDTDSIGAKSNVVISGNYIKGNNSINASWYGNSQNITKFVISNNNVGIPIRVHAETTDGTSPHENIEVLEWNNVVRVNS